MQEVNPYATPADGSLTAAVATARISNWLRIPAVALIVLSAAWLLACFLAAAIHVWSYWLIVEGAPIDFWRNTWEFAVLLSCIVANALILVGAWNMRRGTRYGFAMIASILACLPFLSPALYLGIPFGLWALIVLLRRRTRETFQRTQAFHLTPPQN